MSLIKSKEILIIIATGVEALHYVFELYTEVSGLL